MIVHKLISRKFDQVLFIKNGYPYKIYETDGYTLAHDITKLKKLKLIRVPHKAFPHKGKCPYITKYELLKQFDKDSLCPF